MEPNQPQTNLLRDTKRKHYNASVSCPVGDNQLTVRLDSLRPGQIGAIIRVGGQAAARRRLLEMGLVRGEKIAVERIAPLGDPVEFIVKGYHLSLRRQDAANIEVVLVS